MDQKEFEVFLHEVLNYIRETLGQKSDEYVPPGNSIFHSFKEAGKAEKGSIL